jgi:protein gp37
MNRTKIEWCDTVWNPVWGCLNDCSYCYARKIAKRFAFKIAEKEKEYCLKNNIRYSDISKDLEEFKPVFLESNFNKKFPKNPSRIFVNSMSDIAFWDRDWMLRVFGKIVDNPQHQFLFLTKEPEVYRKFGFEKNCLLGVTVNKQRDVGRIRILRGKKLLDKNRIFVSFEPLLENIDFHLNTDWVDFGVHIDWIIIGAQTRQYKPPKKEWIEGIMYNAKGFYIPVSIPVFLKNNLYKAYPDLPKLQEFPNDL